MAITKQFEQAILASKQKKNARFRQRNLSLFEAAGLTLIAGDPFRDANTVTLRCSEGHEFETLVAYVVRGLKKIPPPRVASSAGISGTRTKLK